MWAQRPPERSKAPEKIKRFDSYTFLGTQIFRNQTGSEKEVKSRGRRSDSSMRQWRRLEGDTRSEYPVPTIGWHISHQTIRRQIRGLVCWPDSLNQMYPSLTGMWGEIRQNWIKSTMYVGSQSTENPGYYLLHQVVMKEDRCTDKVRIMWGSSSQKGQEPTSLQLHLKEPNRTQTCLAYC